LLKGTLRIGASIMWTKGEKTKKTCWMGGPCALQPS